MTYIKINNEKIPVSVQTRREDPFWNGRESKALTMEMGYEKALNLFLDGVKWSVQSEYENENNVLEIVEADMSEYAIAGPITDNRNGTVTVRMGKHKQEELAQITLKAVPVSFDEAVFIRNVIEYAVQTVEENTAVKVTRLFPTWEELVEKSYVAQTPGFKFSYKGELYKTLADMTEFKEHWIPGNGTEAIFVKIDETHSGTKEDAIPYNGNMALENGKYYTQAGVLYMCVRDTVNPVYNNLSDLTGIYVEVVE